MAKLPQKKNRPARILARVRKDVSMARRTKRTRPRPATRKNATVVLAQGAAAVPRRVFGTRHGRPRSIRQCFKLLDARVPQTLGLPRAVGPYTVMRTSTMVSSSSNFVMFAPFQYMGNSWYDWCGIESVDAAQDITSTNNTKQIKMPMLHLGEACSVVPAALTVQVMNPSSLNHATGVFAMARVNQQLCLATQPAGVTWNSMVQQIISYYSPRMLTGGRLALRAVKCNAYPLDMSEYASFNPVDKPGYNLFTWSDSNLRPAALSPICFVQDNDQSPQTIEFLVTIEWRVRFDPGHPATSTHTYHETVPDEVWNGVIKAASDAGHGVEDVAEEVANIGDPFD